MNCSHSGAFALFLQTNYIRNTAKFEHFIISSVKQQPLWSSFQGNDPYEEFEMCVAYATDRGWLSGGDCS